MLIRLDKREPELLKKAVRALLMLALIFYISYGFATWITDQRNDVGNVVFMWERHIPFLPWTIVPYWSINLLYGLSFLIPRTALELKRHIARLLSAQVICVLSFLCFPLEATFIKPEVGGFYGELFNLLSSFDKQYNQAPSLHITLLVILWATYYPLMARWSRFLLHGWFFLIGLSVLTTWQHHFLDVPLGILVGCFVLWLWPFEGSSPLSTFHFNLSNGRLRWVILYGILALLSLILGVTLGGMWLILNWPAVSFAMVAFNYMGVGAKGFQKRSDGSFTVTNQLLFFPYIVIMAINSRLWTHGDNGADEIAPNLYLGRIPTRKELLVGQYDVVIDLTAEFPFPLQCRWHSLSHRFTFQGAYYSYPMLDMVKPTCGDFEAIRQLVKTVAVTLEPSKKILICCGLGYSRSVIASLIWLVEGRELRALEDALSAVKRSRPRIVISQDVYTALEDWWEPINIMAEHKEG